MVPMGVSLDSENEYDAVSSKYNKPMTQMAEHYLGSKELECDDGVDLDELDAYDMEIAQQEVMDAGANSLDELQAHMNQRLFHSGQF